MCFRRSFAAKWSWFSNIASQAVVRREVVVVPEHCVKDVGVATMRPGPVRGRLPA